MQHLLVWTHIIKKILITSDFNPLSFIQSDTGRTGVKSNAVVSRQLLTLSLVPYRDSHTGLNTLWQIHFEQFLFPSGTAERSQLSIRTCRNSLCVSPSRIVFRSVYCGWSRAQLFVWGFFTSNSAVNHTLVMGFIFSLAFAALYRS